MPTGDMDRIQRIKLNTLFGIALRKYRQRVQRTVYDLHDQLYRALHRRKQRISVTGLRQMERGQLTPTGELLEILRSQGMPNINHFIDLYRHKCYDCR